MTSKRARVDVRGAVQGVGFRPFVFRLARALELQGWVRNSRQGVCIEIEGARSRLDQFLQRLEQEKPPYAAIYGLDCSFLDTVGHIGFSIENSDDQGPRSVVILPDLATCPECVRETFDPLDRRYRYPFTNCTHCGPRFTIIEDVPYDRARTSMRTFPMCPACEREYHDPYSRRFHAQPNACPVCGPQLEFWDGDGRLLAQRDDALRAAAEQLRRGRIVALKGVGGFQLLVDARDEAAVRRLRRRKYRAEKPFAVMYPDLAAARHDCYIDELEEQLLQSAEAPIVLIYRREGPGLTAPSVAPEHPTLGVMLPYSPLHHLLLHDAGFPVIATSGNYSDETICTHETEALARLRGIADCLLVHNRPIVRHADDSIVRVQLGRELVLRRARGYAPLPVRVPENLPVIIALGAQLKNAVAVGGGSNVCLSQHIGDLETAQALAAFQRVAVDLPRLLGVTPNLVACDLHPEYLSTKYARATAQVVVPVQHHYAHVLSGMAENGLTAPVLGVCWDGNGLGTDGTVWGGEFLHVDDTSFRRVGHFRTFRLPGGDAAARQPRRSALGLLYELHGAELFARESWAPLRRFSRHELRLLRQMFERRLNVPLTSSAGRLFDGVASLVGFHQRTSYEGQAAVALEHAVDPAETSTYPWSVTGRAPLVYDWAPTIAGVLADVEAGVAAGRIAARFHRTLAEVIVAVATTVGIAQVVLTGGCFQNRYLTALAVQGLRQNGLQPFWHRYVPANDGGLALGQVMAAARASRASSRAAQEFVA